jgi:hypothetical protein
MLVGQNQKLKMNSPEKPHFRKTRHFISIFPHSLVSVEWSAKWPIRHKYGKTYNPDFWCDGLGCFIELATSRGNVYAECEKWVDAILRGYRLRVFWWTGMEITGALLDGTLKVKSLTIESPSGVCGTGRAIPQP